VDASAEMRMAPQASGRTISGHIAARIDRLPLTRVQWQIALLVELAWGVIIVDTDGIGGRLYPYVWKAHNWVSLVQYGVLQAFAVGLGVLIGDFLMSYFADRYGRRPAIIASSLLAGFFIWPFALVHSFVPLLIVSILSTLGVGAIVATHAVYLSEIINPEQRNSMLLGSQSVTAAVGVLSGILAIFWIPAQWQLYVWFMAGFQLVLLFPLLLWGIPESPRWLEAQGRHADAERVMAQLEERVAQASGRPLPEPDGRPRPVVLAEAKGLRAYREIFRDPQYRGRLLVLLAAWFFGYAGVVYGAPAFILLYMADHGWPAALAFTLVTIAGIFRFGSFFANAALKERFERRAVVLWLAVIFTVAYGVMFLFPTRPAMAVFYTVAGIAGSLWLFNMYNYTAVCFPTRIRSIAFGATDGLGHIGAWIGISFMSFLYVLGPNHLGWMAAVTIPGCLLPSILVASVGVRQRAAILEHVAV
jgi:MFS family permease